MSEEKHYQKIETEDSSIPDTKEPVDQTNEI